MAEDDDRLFAEVARLYRSSPPAAPGARARIMERVRAARPPRRLPVILPAWLGLRAVALPPAAWAAAALALLALGGWLGWLARGAGAERTASETARIAGIGAPRLVDFAVQAPGASRVALVGDFNGWDPQASPMRRVGDSWVLTLPVTGGRHVYAFVVDGERWMSDPAAPLAPEDEFGFRKSVLVVGNGSAS